MNANSLNNSKKPAKNPTGPSRHIDFYGHDFYIDSNVLIPRPETEQLIDACLNLAGLAYLPGVKPGERKLPENPVIYDIGTGSGCIAATLKLKIPSATVFATDVSKEALEIAQKNTKNLNATPIHFIIAHLLNFVNISYANTPNSAPEKPPLPDLIVANLPYVDETWDWLDKKTLEKEPRLALYANDHGLALIKELLGQAAKLEKPHFLVLEADPCQHAEIKSYAKKQHYAHLETRGFCLVFKTLPD